MRTKLSVLGAVLGTACLFGATGTAAEEAMIEEGSQVSINYTLKVDGEVVDKSPEGQPLEYVQGSGQIIPGLENALKGLNEGDTKEVTVEPEQGYGPSDPDAFVQITRDQLAPGVEPEVGGVLGGTGPDGRPFRARISDIKEDEITLDLNHPLAGKTLNFDIAVVSVESGS